MNIRDVCNLQVETLWNLLRVVCVVLGLVSRYIPAVICATVIFVIAAFLIHVHFEIFPFHSHFENSLRGGIYVSVAWTAFARWRE